ncbi:4-carboxymuconolactone decarboxylase-like protein [Dothidotthia symphoricarpi CBS 119687]|uniref:4-carboxymuconolactone decarboxylase-like protein n=1 Tax=Dothidotthia symphoricarpi CBS 119687 TaxID=1392245 RepID=A0A6A6A703_9PLEO|nr:4-carboxymuconolactone decarboxylase-like protein [Dothidotthia symphoricarpi CBS 119687]KAF2126411.1 4-carboxymuconolactone decarboxylase-like protein [Dothidotthia symphoricarpi CBS 119687]
MRLPYVSDPPEFENEADKAVVGRILQRRGDKGLIALDRTLLHAPPVADGWNSFLGAIRTATSLSASVRETAICRVAVLNKAWYEWESHSPILRDAPEISPEHVDAVLQSPPRQVKNSIQDEKHAAVMAYTDAMTLDVQVPDDVFEKLKKHFSDKEVVEITATVAAYNCVSRLLVALDVGECNKQEGPAKEWTL